MEDFMSEDSIRKLMEDLARNPEKIAHSEEFKEEKEIYRIAEEMGATFTESIDALRQYAPHPHTRALAHNIWDVIHFRYVYTAVTAEAESISFAVINMNDTICAIILIPTSWLIFCAHDLKAQMGGIILAGSSAVDWYNGRLSIDGAAKTITRARAYEAEYIQSLGDVVVSAPYHKELLAEFPNGFPKELDYPRLPIVG
jgi:hypothetical protein